MGLIPLNWANAALMDKGAGAAALPATSLPPATLSPFSFSAFVSWAGELFVVALGDARRLDWTGLPAAFRTGVDLLAVGLVPLRPAGTVLFFSGVPSVL